MMDDQEHFFFLAMLRTLFFFVLCSLMCLLLWTNTSSIAWVQNQAPLELSELGRMLIGCFKCVMLIVKKMNINYILCKLY